MKAWKKIVVAAALLATVPNLVVQAEEFDDGQSIAYKQALAGKKVVFLPVSMSFDLPQAWAAAMKKAATTYGFDFSIRDPNWSPDAGAQALTQLISEKPDLIVVHNIDMQVYARLLRKAMDAGINVLQINLKSTSNTDAYVGADWYQVGKAQAEMAVTACGKGSGKSGKIAIIQGTPTNPNNSIELAAMEEVFGANPEIKIVSNQSADWDATKAHAIAATVLKQNPDLCAVVGMWEVMDAGAAAAIKEANLVGKTQLITNGGGRGPACDSIKAGEFNGYVSYDVPGQARDLVDAIKVILQTKPKPGSTPFALYTPNKIISQASLTHNSCWTMQEIEAAPY
jgi:ABC-type sugar transport system substrate-binding protein